MITVNNQVVDLLDSDWKYLIILDGCRYDIFESVFKDILKFGKLKKAHTNCDGTFEWMQKNFKGKDCSDIIYIDPIVMFKGFMPNDTFFKVSTVWKDSWDYTYGTILPEGITNSALEQMKKYKDKRILVHYHQPHPPYIHPDFIGIEGPVDKPEEILKSDGKKRKFNISQCIQGSMRRFIGCEFTWKWLIRFGIEPLDYYGKIYKQYGIERIVSGYVDTLKLALIDVNRIIEKSKGKLVITSDHSKNFDGSQKNIEKQPVPWLEINKQ